MKKVTLAKLKRKRQSADSSTPPVLSLLPLSRFPLSKKQRCVCERVIWRMNGAVQPQCCTITHHPHFKRSPHYPDSQLLMSATILMLSYILKPPRPAPSSTTGLQGGEGDVKVEILICQVQLLK